MLLSPGLFLHRLNSDLVILCDSYLVNSVPFFVSPHRTAYRQTRFTGLFTCDVIYHLVASPVNLIVIGLVIFFLSADFRDTAVFDLGAIFRSAAVKRIKFKRSGFTVCFFFKNRSARDHIYASQQPDDDRDYNNYLQNSCIFHIILRA